MIWFNSDGVKTRGAWHGDAKFGWLDGIAGGVGIGAGGAQFAPAERPGDEISRGIVGALPPEVAGRRQQPVDGIVGAGRLDAAAGNAPPRGGSRRHGPVSLGFAAKSRSLFFLPGFTGQEEETA